MATQESSNQVQNRIHPSMSRAFVYLFGEDTNAECGWENRRAVEAHQRGTR
jgi:hypothetical protein